MTAFLENHIFAVQISLFLFILLTFWFLEIFFVEQKSKDKILHSFVNAKFLSLVIPVQIGLSVILLSVSARTETENFGLLNHLPIHKNGVAFYLIALVLLDFSNFVYHYFMHKIPGLWRFHQIHHSDMDVDISTTFREHPGETFVRVGFFIVCVYLLGISPWIIIVFQLFESSSNLMSHTKLKLPNSIDKYVSLIFVTPNSHSIHHHFRLPHTDTNYGDILSIWDHLFSTASRMCQKDIVYGINTHMNPVYNASFKLLLKRPFRKKNKDSKATKTALNSTMLLLMLLSVQTLIAQKYPSKLIKDSTVIETVKLSAKSRKRLKKDENPAYKILLKVWENKDANQTISNPFYEFDEFSSTEIGLNGMNKKFAEGVFKKKFDSVAAENILTGTGDKFDIPVELLQTFKHHYASPKLDIEKIQLLGKKDIGVPQDLKLFERLEVAFKNINPYNENIILLNKNFVSPISKGGFGTYDYVLKDSLVANNETIYSIDYFPRESRDLAFRGNFQISSLNYALVSISLKTPHNMNINFVKDLDFSKTYVLDSKKKYVPESNNYNGIFTIFSKKDEKGLFVIKKDYFSNYTFDQTKTLSFYTDVTEEKPPSNNVDYIKENADSDTKKVEKLVEFTSSAKKITGITNALYTLSEGYFTAFKGLQIGNTYSSVATNEIQGFNIRLGFRTYQTLNDRFRLSGFTTYGFKSKNVSFGLESRYLLIKSNRVIIDAAYTNDYQQAGITTFVGNHILPDAQNESKAIFSRGKNYYLSKINRGSLKISMEPYKNLEIGAEANYSIIQSGAPKLFSLEFFNPETKKLESKTNDFNTTFFLNYTPKREVFGTGVDQNLGSKLNPTLSINFIAGFNDIGESQFNYKKLNVLYNYPIYLGKFGIMNSTVIAGKTFNPVPLALANGVSANQTYFYAPNTFSLLNYYQFVADQFLQFNIDHHFNGFIINHIPILNLTKIRSVLIFRSYIGSISEGTIALNRSRIKYEVPRKPYVEYGFGLENIGFGNIRPLRVDFVWNNISNIRRNSPKFGIRFGFKTSF
jgi:sterol desaturase/sphingolipid hydroxylase (fatty acid hydroxylase superfamily)